VGSRTRRVSGFPFRPRTQKGRSGRFEKIQCRLRPLRGLERHRIFSSRLDRPFWVLCLKGKQETQWAFEPKPCLARGGRSPSSAVEGGSLTGHANDKGLSRQVDNDSAVTRRSARVRGLLPLISGNPAMHGHCPKNPLQAQCLGHFDGSTETLTQQHPEVDGRLLDESLLGYSLRMVLWETYLSRDLL
jgi:hypothetical protein